MRPPQQYLPSINRIVAAQGDVEWEDLPSLADTLAQRLVNDAGLRRPVQRHASAWDNTLPAELDPLAPEQPFQETLSGLVQRDVYEPDVFRHFFGPVTAT